ncbi:Hypothetical_protein [Hexamita inflata]|uniref:Hypothetical_protein n=1 Tax=Hexamita inflata TaxID=28002 RepID=A0AA86Q7R5_9EUKA|nr:Hypothetical protein HINF_LOCUS35347 [Hexamita inflata]
MQIESFNVVSSFLLLFAYCGRQVLNNSIPCNFGRPSSFSTFGVEFSFLTLISFLIIVALSNEDIVEYPLFMRLPLSLSRNIFSIFQQVTSNSFQQRFISAFALCNSILDKETCKMLSNCELLKLFQSTTGTICTIFVLLILFASSSALLLA